MNLDKLLTRLEVERAELLERNNNADFGFTYRDGVEFVSIVSRWKPEQVDRLFDLTAKIKFIRDFQGSLD